MVAKYGSIDHSVEENDDDNEDNASETSTRRAALFNYNYVLGKHSIEDIAIVIWLDFVQVLLCQ